MFPMVPYHRLPELHEEIKHDSRRSTRRSGRPTRRSSRRSCASCGTRSTSCAASCRPAPPRSTIPTPATTAARCRWPDRHRRARERPPMRQWIAACDVDDIDPEDVIPFDHDGSAYAIYRSPDDAYFATDGHCTHEQTAALRRPGHGRRDRVPQAQRPLRLHHRQGARRARCSSTCAPTRPRSRTAPSTSSCRECQPSAQHGGDGDRRRGRVRHPGRVRACARTGWTGPITLVGGEPELPYERPPLSKTWTHKPICDDERLRAADMTYLPGTHATALDTARATR